VKIACAKKLENHIVKCHFVGHFINYNQIIDPNSPKMMCWIICYISLILISNPEIQTRNDLNSITYHKRNNYIWKKCVYKLLCFAKKFWGGNVQSFERREGKATTKDKA
jgi:hypothetical protein